MYAISRLEQDQGSQRICRVIMAIPFDVHDVYGKLCIEGILKGKLKYEG
jgi:hypothetical protein